MREHHGLYRLGAFGGPFAPEMAALLVAGEEGAVSHQSAVFAYGLRERPDCVHVTNGALRDRADIRVHRAALDPRDIAYRHGLRLTTPARTLVDLAATTGPEELERLVDDAHVARLVTRTQLLAALTAARGRPGVRRLRAVVGDESEPGFTRSEAERRLRELVKTAGLPRPRANARVAGLEVDAVWPEQRLVVEVDGFASHGGTRAAFERDRRRDARLLVAGYRVLRLTWRQLVREPAQVIALLAAALRP